MRPFRVSRRAIALAAPLLPLGLATPAAGQVRAYRLTSDNDAYNSGSPWTCGPTTSTATGCGCRWRRRAPRCGGDWRTPWRPARRRRRSPTITWRPRTPAAPAAERGRPHLAGGSGGEMDPDAALPEHRSPGPRFVPHGTIPCFTARRMAIMAVHPPRLLRPRDARNRRSLAANIPAPAPLRSGALLGRGGEVPAWQERAERYFRRRSETRRTPSAYQAP